MENLLGNLKRENKEREKRLIVSDRRIFVTMILSWFERPLFEMLCVHMEGRKILGIWSAMITENIVINSVKIHVRPPAKNLYFPEV